MDLSAYATTETLNTELAKKADKTVVDGINDRVGTLETNAVLEGDTLVLNCGNSVIA